jgi:membrane-bound lytic murein transglycosylase A
MQLKSMLIKHIILLCAVFLSACQGPQQHLEYTEVTWDDLPNWKGDKLTQAEPALRRSCYVNLQKPNSPHTHFCEDLLEHPQWSEANLRALIQKHYKPYKVSFGGGSKGQFTGYYEPLLKGSLYRKGPYQTPLYTHFKCPNPNSLNRTAIANGALKGQNRELIWVSDPIDAFFLEIQGSGRVQLEDGEVLRVGYAGQNGCPYTAIGKVLIDRGELTRQQATAIGIKNWLRANPCKAREVMNQNESYVFFKFLEGKDGPIGAQGTALTAERSMAVDTNYIPLGSVLWVDIENPQQGKAALQHLIVAQDKGGAIKGALRGDYFWGFGGHAEYNASVMNSAGTLYMLKPVG